MERYRVDDHAIPSKYTIHEEPDGFRVEGRGRTPVAVRVEPYRFLVNYDDPSWSRGYVYARGLYPFQELLDTVCQGLLRTWQPHHASHWAMHRRLREWAETQTRKTLARRIYAQYQRLLNRFDPMILEVHKKVLAATYQGASPLIAHPWLYRREHRFIVQDILNHRAAAVAAGATVMDEVCGRRFRIKKALARMAEWRGIFSPTGQSYRTLDRTLMNLPGGVPAWLVYSLSRFRLERPLTKRVELITTALASYTDLNRSKRHNFLLFHRAQETEIKEALQLVADHTRNHYSSRRTRDLRALVLFLGDYPEPYHGTLVGLARKSMQWHEHLQRTPPRPGEGSYPAATPVVKPPIELPASPAVTFLETAGALYEEGEHMRHCVGSYASRAVKGAAYFFHVEHQGGEATVQVDALSGRVIQTHGPRNKRNRASVWGRKILTEWGRGLQETQLQTRKARIRALPDTLDDDDVPF
jgi:PcfJ-like protein